MHVCTSRLRGRRPAWNGSWRWLASCSFACCLIPIWIMTTLAAQLAIAIENARLYEQIARQETRLERELALARELQFRLLPHSLPKMMHLEVQAKFVPARAIGGDLYDFVPYSLSRLGIAIGDVSGKGAPQI